MTYQEQYQALNSPAFDLAETIKQALLQVEGEEHLQFSGWNLPIFYQEDRLVIGTQLLSPGTWGENDVVVHRVYPWLASEFYEMTQAEWEELSEAEKSDLTAIAAHDMANFQAERAMQQAQEKAHEESLYMAYYA